MDRLTSLTAFVRVVDSGGFSAAGRRLNMSTTMVSNHVQALEDRLGARLLQSHDAEGQPHRSRQGLLRPLHPDPGRSRTGRRHRRRLAIDAARHAAHLHRHPYRAVRRARGRRISCLISRGQGRPDDGRTHHRSDRRGIRSCGPADAAARIQPDRPQPRDLAACVVLFARLSRKARTAAAIVRPRGP